MEGYSQKINLPRKFSWWLRLAVFLNAIAVGFIFFALSAHAATMYFSPSSGSYSVGRTFSVGVYVSSADQSVNAISGTVSFPANLLEVTGVSKSGSIIGLWVAEPGFSNGGGTVDFEGVILNPGYIGSSGRVVTINFKVKSTGSAALNFSSASVLANDGRGTNVLSGAGSAQFDIAVAQTTPAAEESTTPSAATGAPQPPKITSSTHANPDKWYNNNDPKFDWALPAGITGVNFLADNEPSSNPGTTSDGVVRTHTYPDVEDGVWYMHLRLRNATGWGGVSHFKFQIDTQKPTVFTVKEVVRDDLTDPSVGFNFQASDALSGIDHYEIQIDTEKFDNWYDDGSHIFNTPVLPPGRHTLLAKAVDKAGNSLASSVDFTIEGLEPPVFTDYPKELSSGSVLNIKGKTYPGMTVVVWLQREEDEAKEYSLPADSQGNFTFIASERLRDGVYRVWGEVVNSKGAHSNPSSKLTIYVRPSAIGAAASKVTVFLSVAVPLVAVSLLLVMVLWYFWHKYHVLKRRLKKEVREAEESLHESFDKLRDDVREKVKMLEKTRSKRELTQEEAKIVRQLRRDLDEAERIVKKEIADIDKVVR